MEQEEARKKKKIYKTMKLKKKKVNKLCRNKECLQLESERNYNSTKKSMQCARIGS